MADKVEANLVRVDDVYKATGDASWKTVAVLHVFDLFETRESITLDDVIASLEEEVGTSRMFKVMNRETITHLRHIQERQKSA